MEVQLQSRPHTTAIKQGSYSLVNMRHHSSACLLAKYVPSSIATITTWPIRRKIMNSLSAHGRCTCKRGARVLRHATSSSLVRLTLSNDDAALPVGVLAMLGFLLGGGRRAGLPRRLLQQGPRDRIRRRGVVDTLRPMAVAYHQALPRPSRRHL